MLPDGWRETTVGQICQFRNGHGFGPNDWDTQGLPIIRIQNLNGGKEFDYFSRTPEPSWLVEPGQILFSWAGTRGVSFGPCVWQGQRGVLNQHIFKVEPAHGIHKGWLYWVLRHVTNRIEAQAHGFKATLLHVKKSDIERQIVTVPPAPAQRRIADAMATWDESISASERLLANLRRQKQVVMQRALCRSSDWPHVRLDEIAERVTRRADASGFPVLMISSGTGFVHQNEKYSRFMAGKSVEHYTLLRRGEFAYNKGNSKRYEFGCVYPLESIDAGLVPHVYVCFKLQPLCDPAFIKYLFEDDYLHDQLGALVNTGVRNNGLLNIKPSDFMAVTVPVPSLADQRQIADVMRAASAQIAQQEKALALLRQEKQVLMKQLLTGQRRLHAPELAAETVA